jgi:predicted transcriptional regulator
MFACPHGAEREISMRLWQKLSRLIEFPRRVLIELEEIRRAQTRLDNDLDALKTHVKNSLEETRQGTLTAIATHLESLKQEAAKAEANYDETIKKWTALATSRFENFFRLSIQNQDSSNELIAAIRRKIDDHTGATEAAIKDLKESVSGNANAQNANPPDRALKKEALGDASSRDL